MCACVDANTCARVAVHTPVAVTGSVGQRCALAARRLIYNSSDSLNYKDSEQGVADAVSRGRPHRPLGRSPLSLPPALCISLSFVSLSLSVSQYLSHPCLSLSSSLYLSRTLVSFYRTVSLSPLSVSLPLSNLSHPCISFHLYLAVSLSISDSFSLPPSVILCASRGNIEATV